jgi:GTPase SAR1 family protein
VYDITDRQSVNSIRSWINQIDAHADSQVNKVLIGNKSDLAQHRVIGAKFGRSQ